MVGADYPWPEANERGVTPYPMTASQKAVYYRDLMAKRPVNLRNIKHRTGSTILGNYNNNYDVVHTFGAYSNPRNFVENQPTLPPQAIQNNMTSSTSVRTFLDTRRLDDNHTSSVDEYSLSYLTSALSNSSVVTTRFSAPGGIEVMTPGYMDIRSAEISVYNNINYRNLAVRGVFQTSGLPSGSSGSVDRPPTGSGTTAIRVDDIHGKAFALRSHLARHTARFGRDSLLVTGTTAADNGPGASYDQQPSMFKIHRNRIDVQKFDAAGSTFSSSIFDNYFVSQQIPKSTINYSWIRDSYISFNDRYGIVRPDFEISSSTGIINSIDFLSSSEAISFYNGGLGLRLFGDDARYTPPQSVPTSFVGLNLNVIDTLETSSATIGTSTVGLDYLNNGFVGAANAYGTASILNSLILSRQGPYGHPSWKQVRQRDNKLLRNYRQNNQLKFVSSTGSFNSQAQFEMPPVSMRGRTLTVAIDDLNTELAVPGFGPSGPTVEGATTLLLTLKGDFSNNYVYYNLDKFEDQFNMNYYGKTTAGEQLIEVGNSAGFALNWIIYRENIFPSQRNEFLSRSRNKIGFDNKYWRDSNADRVTLGDTFNNTQNIDVSQSSWVLDAPEDFVTRTGPTLANLLSGGAFPASSSVQLKALRDSLRNSSSAGELQNTYFTYFTSSVRPAGTNATDVEKAAVLTPGALYARKQTISSPRSVSTPSGMQWALTGANTGPFDGSSQIQVFAGEAKWETGDKAGIIAKSLRTGDTFTLSERMAFQSNPSKPWFNSYDDFNYLIKKVSNAKEFAVVPEYRSSIHAQDYVSVGFRNESKFDTFSIPETQISSSQSEFYIDYSNSEFLKEFLNIKDLARQNLQAKEIRLVCSGTIRFNPYKSFYPAQRATDVVERFYKSFSGWNSGSSAGSGSWGDVGYAEGVSGSQIKSLYQPLFAPGILFNSIKSGLAVDWPIITDFDKVIREQYGDSQNASKDNWAIATNTASFGRNQSFWDKRLDFKTIIHPTSHIDKIEFVDMDSHPSCSVPEARYKFEGEPDILYSSMASNFLAEASTFFLKGSTRSSLKSKSINSVVVANGKTYMARVKLRRSMSGSRDYSNEYASSNTGFSNNAFGPNGGKLLVTASSGTPFDFSTATGAEFPLPQDPQRNTGSYHETFTMYSRPTAFGPPVAGLGSHSTQSIASYVTETVYDSFTGYNPAYTPPYYNGEAWCDIIYRPTGSSAISEVTIEDIQRDATLKYWRMDPGFASSSVTTATNPPYVRNFRTTLIFDESVNGRQAAPYEGPFINQNSMQISASIELLGVEDTLERQTSLMTKEQLVTNVANGTRWVISPKFETPMLNFNDLSSVRQLTSSEVTLPENFGQASVPRGMWHQFGIIEPDTTKGIFLEIADIPENWLKYHYDVRLNDTVYNDFDAINSGSEVYKNTESLVDLVGFTNDTSARLGELKEELTVYEAVVAVPYIIKALEPSLKKDISLTEAAKDYKKFISIPEERYQAALTSSIGTATGDYHQSVLQPVTHCQQQANLFVAKLN
jgi:hypothetical protein